MITVLAMSAISTVFADADAPPAPCEECGTLTSITRVYGPCGSQASCCDDCFDEILSDLAEQDARREYAEWAENHCPVCERSTHIEERYYGGGCICIHVLE